VSISVPELAHRVSVLGVTAGFGIWKLYNVRLVEVVVSLGVSCFGRKGLRFGGLKIRYFGASLIYRVFRGPMRGV